MTDRDLIENLSVLKNDEVVLEELGLFDPDQNKKQVGVVLAEEGNNGKYHGQKGHKKAYLYFNFDLAGKLADIKVYVPSSGSTFSFLENSDSELNKPSKKPTLFGEDLAD